MKIPEVDVGYLRSLRCRQPNDVPGRDRPGFAASDGNTKTLNEPARMLWISESPIDVSVGRKGSSAGGLIGGVGTHVSLSTIEGHFAGHTESAPSSK
jgi:hypothetical protein